MALACVSVLVVITNARSENVRILNAEKVSLRDNNLDETLRILLRYLCIYW